MRKTRPTRIPTLGRGVHALIALTLGTLLLAAGFWEYKPYMKWTEEEAVRMLTHSPWAQAHVLSRAQFRQWTDSYAFGPRDSPCDCRDSVTTFPIVATNELTSQYSVRFETAAPIRRALSRLWFLRNMINRDEAERLAQSNPFEGYIVVVVSATPNLARSELDTICTASLQDSTCVLSFEGSGRSISLYQYLSPRQVGTGEAYFIFPRVRLLQPDETAVRFDCRLNIEARIFSKFELEGMWFEGRLEI